MSTARYYACKDLPEMKVSRLTVGLRYLDRFSPIDQVQDLDLLQDGSDWIVVTCVHHKNSLGMCRLR